MIFPRWGHCRLKAKTFADITKAADYDRFALVGVDNISRLAANLIAQSIGKADKLKYFANTADARAWLLASGPNRG